MTRISVRGFAVASATAVTAVGAVVGGVASAGEQGDTSQATEPVGATLLADIPSGEQAQQAVSANFGQQALAQADAADTEARKAAEEAARKEAAQQAADRKAAAEEAARKKAEERKQREEAAKAASRSESRVALTPQSSYTVAQVQAIAQQIVGGDQYQCFSNIVTRESGWNYKAVNPSSGAYGLVQALPGHKMASAGADWQTNPATQIKWGLNYMNERYGSPCGAWSFWQTNHWY
ncbi:transglycosylase SLT domain-containing protein [Streptomyces capparidis]